MPRKKKWGRLSPAQAALVADNLPLARHCAGRFRRRTGLDGDDLLDAAVLSLIETALWFDPDRGVPFGKVAGRFVEQRLRQAAERLKARRRPTPFADLDSDDSRFDPAAEDAPAEGGELLDLAKRALPAGEWGVLESWVVRGLTQREVGDGLGLSHTRVQQIAAQALERLRASPEVMAAIGGGA